MIHKLIVIIFMLLMTASSDGYAESGSSLFDNGIAEYQKGRYQDAVFWFTKLIEKEPFNAKAYKNRGVARLSLQRYDMAIENLNSALNPDPQLEEITGNLGPSWHYKEEYKKAMDDFNSALNLDPDLEGIHSNIGVAWYYAREYQKAVSEYDKELKKHPENYSAFFNRALAWVELKDYQKALKDLESVLTIKHDEYWAIAYKGDIYSELNNPAAAREAYLAAMNLNTGDKYAREKLWALDNSVSSIPSKTQLPEKSETQAGEADRTIPSVPSSKSTPPKTAETASATMEKNAPEKIKGIGVSAEKKSVKTRTMAYHAEKQKKEIPDETEKSGRVSSALPAPTTDQLPPLNETNKNAPAKFTIQLGAFLNSTNADELVKKLKDKGYVPRVVELQDKKERQWTLVRTGSFPTGELAKPALEKVKKELKVEAAIRPIGRF